MGTNPEINLRDRDNMFLAKVAGEEVDFTTITPSIPVSDREKLLMKIDERIGAIESAEGEGGGSGEGGETITPTLITCEVTMDGTTVTTTNMGQICAALRAVVENPAVAPFYTAHTTIPAGSNIAVFVPYIDDDGNISALCGASWGTEEFVALAMGNDGYEFVYSAVSSDITFVEDDLEEDGSYVCEYGG